MTQYWDELDDGSLAYWCHMRDPTSDNPDVTTTEWASVWGDYPADLDQLCATWLNEQAVPNDIAFADAIRILSDLQVGNFNRVQS